MKIIKTTMYAVVLVLCALSSVKATTYTHHVTHNKLMGPSWMGGVSSVNWTFDITKDGFVPFPDGVEEVTSANVSLNFYSWDYDDQAFGGLFSEHASLTLGVNQFVWEVDYGEISFALTSLMTLNSTGTVNAFLNRTQGAFYFKNSSLTAYTGGGSNSVPEPAAFTLIGIGLVGLVGATVRRREK